MLDSLARATLYDVAWVLAVWALVLVASPLAVPAPAVPKIPVANPVWLCRWCSSVSWHIRRELSGCWSQILGGPNLQLVTAYLGILTEDRPLVLVSAEVHPGSRTVTFQGPLVAASYIALRDLGNVHILPPRLRLGFGIFVY